MSDGGEHQTQSTPVGYGTPVLTRMRDTCIREPSSHLAVFVMQRGGRGHLDFIQNMEYKFVELLSTAFIASDEANAVATEVAGGGDAPRAGRASNSPTRLTCDSPTAAPPAAVLECTRLPAAQLILFGAIFGLVDETLTIAAALSHRSPFLSPFDKREQADAAKRAFSSGGSDHLTVLRAVELAHCERPHGDRVAPVHHPPVLGGGRAQHHPHLFHVPLVGRRRLSSCSLGLAVDSPREGAPAANLRPIQCYSNPLP